MTTRPRSTTSAREPEHRGADEARLLHLLRQLPAPPASPPDSLCTELVRLARDCEVPIQRSVCDALWPQLWQQMQAAQARWAMPSAEDENPHIRAWARCPARTTVDARWPLESPYGDERAARQWAAARCLRLFSGRNVCNANATWETADEFLARFGEECDLYIVLNLASGPRKVCRLLARRAARDHLNAQLVSILRAWETRLHIHSGSFGPALLTQEFVRVNFRYLISRKTITCRQTGEATATYWEHAGAFLSFFSNLIHWRLDGLLKSASGKLRDVDRATTRLGETIESVPAPRVSAGPIETRESQQEQAVLQQRQLAVIRAAVAELPPPLPEVFCASYFIQLDDRDIAQMWSLPSESIRGLMTLCEKTLRFLLGTDHVRPGPGISQADLDQHLYACTARCVERLIQSESATQSQQDAILAEFQCDYLRHLEGP